MKELAFIQPDPLYIEISPDSFRALQNDNGLELPLERQSNGRLTDSCKEKLANNLKTFVKRKSWQLPIRAFCAIGASGVSLRRLTLPPVTGEELQRLLLLQIEAEFPVDPEELAWGYLPLNGARSKTAAGRPEFLVAAVRKDVIEEYSRLLSDFGVRPVFTLAGMARSCLCPQPSGIYVILDVDRQHSEWTGFENNVPAVLRVLPLGTDQLATSNETLDLLAKSVRSNSAGRPLYLSGVRERGEELAAALGRHLGNNAECHSLDAGSGTGHSAALLGLKKWVEDNNGTPPLWLQTKPKPAEGKFRWSDPVLRKPTVAAGLLLIVLLALPYAQAFLLKPFLSRKLTSIEADQGRLDTIDRELGFLEFLKENQPPYLDALYLFAKTAPMGTRLDSVTMNRKGEVSLRGSMRNFEQVVEFRTGLVKSGFFTNVSVEEQTPTLDHQKVNIRIVAHWKPAEARALLTIGPTAAEIAKAKAGHKKPSANAMPFPGGPPVMMPHGGPPPQPLKH